MKAKLKQRSRIRRHARVRKKVSGTGERPRLTVFRSLRHIYAQVIDDELGVTLAAMSTLSPEIRGKVKSSSNIDAAKLVGTLLAQRAMEKGIQTVVFDKGGYKYHGRVKALADAAREAGLKF